MAELFFRAEYKKLAVSDPGFKTTRKLPLPPLLPMNPNTMIKMNGKTKLKTIADGLLSIDLRLALVMANIALNWLYSIQLMIESQNYCKKIT